MTNQPATTPPDPKTYRLTERKNPVGTGIPMPPHTEQVQSTVSNRSVANAGYGVQAPVNKTTFYRNTPRWYKEQILGQGRNLSDMMNLSPREFYKLAARPGPNNPYNYYLLDDPSLPEYAKQKEIYFQYLNLPVEKYGVANKDMGFWENPTRIARYNAMIQNAPQGWTPPAWLDTEMIKTANNYMSIMNQGKPWWQWKALPEEDPLNVYLRDSATIPDTSALLPTELNYAPHLTGTADLNNGIIPDFSKMKGWQQVALSLFSSQPMENRPEWTRGAFGSALLAGVGTGALGAAVGNVPGAVIGFVAGAGSALYTNYTGKTIPVLSQLMNVFNLPAQGLEQVLGLAAMIEDKDWNAVFGKGNFAAALEASKYFYETTGQNWMLNTAAGISNIFTEEDSPLAKPGETWKLEQGYTEPQMIRGVMGAQALSEARSAMQAGASAEATYADIVDRFGFSGTINDFVYQSILDPLNLAPFLEGRVGSSLSNAVAAATEPGSKINSFAQRAGWAFEKTTGKAWIDVLPFGLQQIVEKIAMRKNPDLHSSAGLVGAFRELRSNIRGGEFPRGMTGVAPADLGGFEKLIGGLTSEGELKNLQPLSGKKGILGIREMLVSLKPEAKAVAMNDIVNKYVSAMFMTTDAPGELASIIAKAGTMSPREAGKLGEIFMNSPELATVSAALRDFAKTGKLDTFVIQYESAARQRGVLELIAKATKETTGSIIDEFTKNPDKLATRLNASPEVQQIFKNLGQAISTESLKDLFDVFTRKGADYVPFDIRELKANMAMALSDHMDGWLVERLGIKPDRWYVRLSNSMKSVMSLMMLNSPTYPLNNFLNSVPTRAVQGISGFMTSAQVARFNERWQLNSQRLTGVGVVSHMAGDTGSTKTKIQEAMDSKDVLSKINGIIRKTKPLQIFVNLSAKIEDLEGRAATAIGTIKMWDKLWQRGKGFSTMPAHIEAALDRVNPEIKNAIYNAVEAGMNMEEITASLFEGAITKDVNTYIQEAAEKYYPGQADIGRELFKVAFIDQELKGLLQGATTKQQIDAAFDLIKGRIEDTIDYTIGSQLETRGTEVEALVKQNGWPAAMELFSEAQTRVMERWLQHYEKAHVLAEQTLTMSYERSNAMWRKFNKEESRAWERINQFELQSLAGIIKGLKMDNQESRSFIAKTKMLQDSWRAFFDGYDIDSRTKQRIPPGIEIDAQYIRHYDGKNDILRKYHSTNYTDKASRRLARDSAFQQIKELADAQQEYAKGLQQEIDLLFAGMFEEHSGRPAQDALLWRQNVENIRDEMYKNMDMHQERILNITDPEKRSKAWNEFTEKYYNQMIIKLKGTEIQGAKDLANGTRTRPDAPTTGKDISGIPVMITGAMQRRLNQLGYLDDAVSKMTPSQAWEIIKQNKPVNEQAAADMSAVVNQEAIQNQIQADVAEASILSEAEVARARGEAAAQAVINRSIFREMQKTAGVSQDVIDATMTIIDLRADQWAKTKGYEPGSKEGRDAFYASVFKDFIKTNWRPSEQARQTRAFFQAPDGEPVAGNWYYLKLYKAIYEIMPDKFFTVNTPEEILVPERTIKGNVIEIPKGPKDMAIGETRTENGYTWTRLEESKWRKASEDQVLPAKIKPAEISLAKDQLIKALKDAGVKDIELKWTGLKTWLDGLTDQAITREDILKRMNSGVIRNIDLTITRLGDEHQAKVAREAWEQQFILETASDPDLWQGAEEMGWITNLPDYKSMGYKERVAFLEDNIDESIKAEGGEVQAEAYQENSIATMWDAARNIEYQKYRNVQHAGYQPIRGTNYAEWLFQEKNRDYGYQAPSLHYAGNKGKDLQVHMRTNDIVVLPNETNSFKRPMVMLNILEAQADWAQKIEKHGARDEAAEAKRVEIARNRDEARSIAEGWERTLEEHKNLERNLNSAAMSETTYSKAIESIKNLLDTHRGKRVIPNGEVLDLIQEFQAKKNGNTHLKSIFAPLANVISEFRNTEPFVWENREPVPTKWIEERMARIETWRAEQERILDGMPAVLEEDTKKIIEDIDIYDGVIGAELKQEYSDNNYRIFAPVERELDKIINNFKEEAGRLELEMADIDRLPRDYPLRKNYLEAAIKMAIYHAAMAGYDGVVMTSGEMQFLQWGSEKYAWEPISRTNMPQLKPTADGKWIGNGETIETNVRAISALTNRPVNYGEPNSRLLMEFINNVFSISDPVHAREMTRQIEDFEAGTTNEVMLKWDDPTDPMQQRVHLRRDPRLYENNAGEEIQKEPYQMRLSYEGNRPLRFDIDEMAQDLGWDAMGRPVTNQDRIEYQLDRIKENAGEEEYNKVKNTIDEFMSGKPGNISENYLVINVKDTDVPGEPESYQWTVTRGGEQAGNEADYFVSIPSEDGAVIVRVNGVGQLLDQINVYSGFHPKEITTKTAKIKKALEERTALQFETKSGDNFSIAVLDPNEVYSFGGLAQSGGFVEGTGDLEQLANQRGLVSNAEGYFTDQESLARLMDQVHVRDDEGGGKHADRIWRSIQKGQKSGAYLPRYEGMKQYYDKRGRNAMQELADEFGMKMEPVDVPYKQTGALKKLNAILISDDKTGGVRNDILQRGFALYQNPDGTRYTAEQFLTKLKEVGFISTGDVLEILGTRHRPQYMEGVVNFLTEQRKKLVSGSMTTRDVAKAMILNAASQRASEITLAAFQQKMNEAGLTFRIPNEYLITKNGKRWIRPEDAMSAWMMSEGGKTALDAIERGAYTPEALNEAVAVRQAFGSNTLENNNVLGTPSKGKYNLTNIQELTEKINEIATRIQEDPNATNELSELVSHINGASGAKEGFLKHMLGMGDSPTIDSVEINLWLTGKGKGSNMDTVAGQLIRELNQQPNLLNRKEIVQYLKNNIRERMWELRSMGAGADIPAAAFEHVMHHWLWDRAKGTMTTHEGMYDAIRLAQQEGMEPKGSTEFDALGRAAISLFEKGDTSTIVHELGHVFRRQIFGEELDAVAKWGGLQDSGELLRLQRLCDAGTISDADYKKYEAMEEKFAKGWEQHIMRPNDAIPPALRSVFAKFTTWLKDIYKAVVQALGHGGTDEDIFKYSSIGEPNIDEVVTTSTGRQIKIRDIMNRLLFDDEMTEIRKTKGQTIATRPSGGFTASFMVTDPTKSIRLRYKLVDIDDLLISHTADYKSTPGFPKELQNKFQMTDGNKIQVEEYAKNLAVDALLTPTSEFDRGSIIAGRDGAVISGNHRAMAIRLAEMTNNGNYEKYKALLQRQLIDYGFQPSDMEGIKKPILIRMIDDPNIDLVTLVQDSNAPGKAGLTAMEQAAQDAGMIKDEWMGIEVPEGQPLKAAFDYANNESARKVIAGFIEGKTGDELRTIIGENGELTEEGAVRLVNALLLKTYGSPQGLRMVSLFTNEQIQLPAGMENVKKALMASLGEVSNMEAQIRTGTYEADYSITNDIESAVLKLYELKKTGSMSVSDYVNSMDLGEAGQLIGFQKQLLAVINKNLRSYTRLRQLFGDYATAVLAQPIKNQQALEMIPKATKGEILDAVVKKLNPDADANFSEAENAIKEGLQKDVTPEYASTEGLTKSHTLMTKHGDYFTNERYEKNGREIAIIPMNTTLKDVITAKGVAHILGLDPVNPNVWVYEINGQILKSGDSGAGGRALHQIPDVNPDADPATEIWRLAAEYGLAGIDPKSGQFTGAFSTNTRMRLIYYIKKWGTTNDKARIQTFEDITPEILGRSITREQAFYAAQGKLEGIEEAKPASVVPPQGSTENQLPGEMKVDPSSQPVEPGGPMGENPTADLPRNQYDGLPLEEMARKNMEPMFESIRESMKADLDRPKLNIPAESVGEIKKWLGQVRTEMAGTKLQATRYGETQRDAALLNYQAKVGFDDFANMIFPYQFWYTRSALEWALRMIDKPALFALYARYRQAQKKMEQSGIPTRMKGKVRMPAAYLPDWMGGGLWSDPMRYFLPIDSLFGKPLEDLARNKQTVGRQAEQNLYAMLEDKTITQEQLDQALNDHSGDLWEKAYAQAKMDTAEETSDPMNLINIVMSPALWLQAPYYLATGQADKLSPLPITRTAMAYDTALDGTILAPIGKLVGMAAWPEKKVREALGISIYGQWGEYYIDRMLANMATEDEYGPEATMKAMMERTGPVYEEALKRVSQEVSLKTPGVAQIFAMKDGLGSFVKSLFEIFPGSLLPEGELKQRNLQGEYNQAWSDLKAGDADAIDRFFEAHPEYRARIMSTGDADTRLRNHLVNIIWDGYSSLEGANKSQAQNALGNDFTNSFLNSETRDYSAISIAQLTLWAKMLKQDVPETEETSIVTQAPEAMIPNIELYTAAEIKAIKAYQEEKNQKFPMVNVLQEKYFAYSDDQKAERRAFLANFPLLKEYWDWKDAYKTAHPELDNYFTNVSEQFLDQEGAGEINVSNMDPMLVLQLLAYVYAGQDLGEGTTLALDEEYENAETSMSKEEFIQAILNSIQ